MLPEGAPPPAAAIEAVKLCGMLPLAISIAGSMLRELADDWETSLVAALRSDDGAELLRGVGFRPLVFALDGVPHLQVLRALKFAADQAVRKRSTVTRSKARTAIPDLLDRTPGWAGAWT